MNLPKEILEEILSRLPVKSLCRFMCVSNLFNCVISCDHQFQNKHLKNCTRNLESKRVLDHVDFNIMVSCSLYSAYYNNTIVWRPNYTSDKERRNCIPITIHCSSFNGLFCVSLDPAYVILDPLRVSFSHWFEIFLWNPTINELRRLPNSPLDLSEERSRLQPLYGLGYDSTNDDYVVVRLIITRYLQVLDQGSIKVELYSLKHDSWRLIQPFPYPVIIRGTNYLNGHFVNNRFHWMVLCDKGGGYGSSKWMIVSLNLSNDEYKDIPLPNKPHILKNNNSGHDIVVLDGLLCMFMYSFGNSFDLWIMKEYGIEESWTRTVSISRDDILGPYDGNIHINLNSRLFSCMVPLYLFENGDVLLKTRTHDVDHFHKQRIMIYKKDEKVFKPWFGSQIRARGGSYIYTESLISPNRYMTLAASRIAKFLNRVSRDRLIQCVSY